MRQYTPRRANKTRWLQDAPAYVLDVIDNKEFHDRYAVLLTGEQLIRDENKCDYAHTYIQYLGLSESGASYWGEMHAHEAAAFRYRSSHHRIRWLDLPECVRSAVMARVEED